MNMDSHIKRSRRVTGQRTEHSPSPVLTGRQRSGSFQPDGRFSGPFEPAGSLDSGNEPRLKYPTYKRLRRLESAYVRRSTRPTASWLSSTLNLSRLLPWPSHREPRDLSTGAGRIDCNTLQYVFCNTFFLCSKEAP